MTVLDLEKHQPIAFLALAKGPDVVTLGSPVVGNVSFDSGLKRIYVVRYSGAIS